MDPNNQNQPTDQQPQTPSFQPVTPPVAFAQPTLQTPVASMASSAPLPQITVAQKDAGHTLGIVSLVMSLLGFGIVGVILGILAISKSKKSGHGTNTMGLIGIIWGVVSGFILLIIIGLVLNNFQGAQGKARDTTSKIRVNAVHSKLEEYYNEANFYPEEMKVSNFPGIDAFSLKSGSEKDIVVITGSDTEADAKSQRKTSSSEPYQYIPFDCTNKQCRGYVLRIHLDSPTASNLSPYTKTGLQNP